VAIPLYALIATAAAFAQAPRSEPFLQQQRRIEEDIRSRFDRELPADQKVDIDYGGWYSFYLMDYDDSIRERHFREHDTRLWGSASFDKGAHEFYARLKLQFLDWNHGDAYDCDEDDTVGPNLDRGYYQFDLRQAMQAYEHEQLDWNFKFKIGRDYVQFGTGYALSTPMDHILMTADLGKVELQSLMGKGIHSEPDLDRSRPDSGSSDRCFWGGQATYTGIEQHRPFVYGFWNEDNKGTPRRVLFQKFGYDSYYLGLGSTGELVQNLRYGTELVFEGGHSYGNRQFLGKDDIQAWAYDANVEYLSQRPYKPRIGTEYMFAEGDGDRFGSPSNSIGGNTRGDDHSFNGFGWRDTGLSFAPRLSNVHIWRVGGAVLPFEPEPAGQLDFLKKLEVGTDYFVYAKNHSFGAVSDPTANRHSGFLGWEMDYFVNWRITSDLSWTTRFGEFFPGASFSEKNCRPFLLTGMTWSF
jgi:hypothetical protein